MSEGVGKRMVGAAAAKGNGECKGPRASAIAASAAAADGCTLALCARCILTKRDQIPSLRPTLTSTSSITSSSCLAAKMFEHTPFRIMGSQPRSLDSSSLSFWSSIAVLPRWSSALLGVPCRHPLISPRCRGWLAWLLVCETAAAGASKLLHSYNDVGRIEPASVSSAVTL